MESDYAGRIDPTAEVYKISPWTELLKERHYIASLFCKNKVVLDSCCGTGWGTLNYIASHAHFTIGFDICQMPKEAKTSPNNCLFILMDARRMALKDTSFDVVLFLDSIEHFTRQDGIKYLLEIRRVCKKNGIVIGSTPLVIDNSLIPTYLQWNKYHRYMYTRKILEKTLKNSFSKVKIYAIYNRICPYFLFFCGRSEININAELEQKMKRYILKRKEEFNRNKISNYVTWAKMLITKKRFLKACYLFCYACLIKMEMFLHGTKNVGSNECL